MWSDRDYASNEWRRQSILTHSQPSPLSGQEKVCGTRKWNKMDCPDYEDALARYRANLARDEAGILHRVRDGVRGQG